MKIVIDDKIPFIKGAFEPIAEVVYLPGAKIQNKDLKDADALITRTRTICNQELLNGTNLKFIATATIGYDHIDTQYCRENGIIWKNAPGCNAGSVMQYIASVLCHLSIKHQFNFADRTLGVVGVGNVGKKVVRLGEALGMRVVLNDPPVMRRGTCGLISLEGILREADIITLHTPLSYEGEDKTFHLFDSKTFSKVNKGSIFINSSRGECADNKAVKDALSSGKLKAAALDVWENEPDIDTDLLKNIDIATPHIAGYAVDGKINGTIMAVRAVSSFFRLGLANWKPTETIDPKDAILEINGGEMSHQEALCKAILHTYNVENDSIYLKNNLHSFEDQRGNYPPHREFHAFTVKLINSTPELHQSLKMIGFNIKFA